MDGKSTKQADIHLLLVGAFKAQLHGIEHIFEDDALTWDFTEVETTREAYLALCSTRFDAVLIGELENSEPTPVARTMVGTECPVIILAESPNPPPETQEKIFHLHAEVLSLEDIANRVRNIVCRASKEHGHSSMNSVLLVEPYTDLRLWFLNTLNDMSFSISACPDWQTAFEYCRRRGTCVDLLILHVDPKPERVRAIVQLFHNLPQPGKLLIVSGTCPDQATKDFLARCNVDFMSTMEVISSLPIFIEKRMKKPAKALAQS